MDKYIKLTADSGFVYTDGKQFGSVVNTANPDKWVLIPTDDPKYMKYLEIQKKSEEKRTSKKQEANKSK